MIDEAKSKRVYNLAILAIVIGLVPLILFFARGVFLQVARPVAPIPKVYATPTVTTTLKKVAGNLEVTVVIRDPSTEPLTVVELRKLTVETTDVIAAKVSLGPLAAWGTVTQHYTIAMPKKLKDPAFVAYEIHYEQGPYSSGGSSGVDSISIK